MAAEKKTSKKRASKKPEYTLKTSDAFEVAVEADIEEDLPAKEKLDIFEVLAAIDRKDRGYYDRLSEHMRKQIPYVVIMRWLSDTQGIPELQHWYLASVNQYANINLHNVPSDDQGARHDKLTWLSLTAASPGMGKQRHGWIGLKKLDDDPRLAFFRKQFPALKEDDIELLAKLNSDDDIKKYARISGQES